MKRERGRSQLRFGEQLLILLEKEWLQMVRDPAVIFMGALLPVVLIVLFGWGAFDGSAQSACSLDGGRINPLDGRGSRRFPRQSLL